MSAVPQTKPSPAGSRGLSVGGGCGWPVAPFAGLDLSRPAIMGIVNVTPDSFSDGGRFLSADAAIAHGRRLLAEGAQILDVGGESTRPGSAPVNQQDEQDRVVPVIRALAAEGAVVSVDTRHAAVMRAALDAGAKIINDVTALDGDPDSLRVAAKSDAAVVIMHMQGEPGTMQNDPRYDDAPAEVFAYLAARVAALEAAGIDKARIAVDPGIGFGKRLEHNLAILADLGRYRELGCALLVGLSRKSFIAQASKGEPADQRLAGSIAGALASLQGGAHILRVHDVAESLQAVRVWQGIAGAARG